MGEVSPHKIALGLLLRNYLRSDMEPEQLTALHVFLTREVTEHRSITEPTLLELCASVKSAVPNAQPVVESERHRIYNDVEESCLFIDEGSVVVENSDQRPRTAVYA